MDVSFLMERSARPGRACSGKPQRPAETREFPRPAASLLACDLGVGDITSSTAGSVLSLDGPGPGPWSDRHYPRGPPRRTPPTRGSRALNQKGRLGRRRGTQVFWWLRPPRGEAGQFDRPGPNPPLVDDVGHRRVGPNPTAHLAGAASGNPHAW